jgi:hypothetical protein
MTVYPAARLCLAARWRDLQVMSFVSLLFA